MDPINLLMEFIIVAAFVYAPVYLAKQMVPSAYRVVQRLMRTLWKPIARLLLLDQVKRRGLAYALCVHALGLLAITTLVMGIVTGTCVSIVAGLLLLICALAAKRFLENLRRVRSRRTRMPGWRR